MGDYAEDLINQGMELESYDDYLNEVFPIDGDDNDDPGFMSDD